MERGILMKKIKALSEGDFLKLLFAFFSAAFLIASVCIFGWRSLLVTAVCVAAAVASEYLYERLCKIPVTVRDFSAVITGMLVAFNVPVSLPLWQAALGSIEAIVLVKQLFGF